MKRPRAWEITRTVILVTAITLLIWMWAEGENVRPYQLRGEVQFQPAQAQQLKIEPQQPSRTIEVSIRVNVAKREEAERILSNGVRIEVSEDPDQLVVNHTIDLLDHLRNMPDFVNNGITVTDVRPQTMTVRVERLVDVPLPIRVDTGGVELASAAQPDVPRASVRVPRRLEESLAGLTLIARTSPARLNALSVNEPHTLGPLPLELPEGYANRNDVVSIEPANIRATLTVRSRRDEFTIPRVPVMAIMPAGMVGQFVIGLGEEQRVLQDVSVEGPTAMIQSIRDGAFAVDAVLKFSADDLETHAGRTRLWPVRFALPEGVVVAQGNTEPQLTITIIRQPVGAPPITDPTPAATLTP